MTGNNLETELFRDTDSWKPIPYLICMDVIRQYLEWLNAGGNMIGDHSDLGSLLWILGQEPGVRMGIF